MVDKEVFQLAWYGFFEDLDAGVNENNAVQNFANQVGLENSSSSACHVLRAGSDWQGSWSAYLDLHK